MKQEGGFLGALLAPWATSLLQPVISSVVKRLIGTGVIKARAGYMDKHFSFPPSFKQYRDY